MARYIDAERLKGFLRLDQSGTEDTLKHGTHLHPVRKLELKAYIGAIEYCVNEINKAPSADVVEVVRCKDCKYCLDAIMSGMWCEHPDNIMPLGSNPDDFCSYGEKKEGTL